MLSQMGDALVVSYDNECRRELPSRSKFVVQPLLPLVVQPERLKPIYKIWIQEKVEVSDMDHPRKQYVAGYRTKH